MRVVVTGGLGFIGQTLSRHLRTRFPGVKLVAVDWLVGCAAGRTRAL